MGSWSLSRVPGYYGKFLCVYLDAHLSCAGLQHFAQYSIIPQFFPRYLQEVHHICWHWGNFKWEVTPCNAYFSCFIIEWTPVLEICCYSLCHSDQNFFYWHFNLRQCCDAAATMLYCGPEPLHIAESYMPMMDAKSFFFCHLLLFLYSIGVPSAPFSHADCLVSFLFPVYLDKI